MTYKLKQILIILIILVPLVLLILALVTGKNNQTAVSEVLKGRAATVYRSKSCGCCANYITYLKRAGVQVEEQLNDDDKMKGIRKRFGVNQELSSCHTTRIDNYTVEGHMPVEVIEKLLAEKPKLAGIALPEMPTGSPGMPGRKTEVFRITGFTDTGSTSPYLSL